MKLIHCHIENFGGLSGYDLKFRDGLTVVAEPNGFGKTSLAEFIRAMFYGFPRAGKFLEKDLRKKYLPWQGGVYGGSLTFEQAGRNYRIERTFGHVPKDDKFILYDADRRRKSDRFSKDIGVELFGLDSDSFGRSTYMPQIHDDLPLSTDSIRAKLGGLIEDTNDVNNFEKALNALRSKRSSLKAFRGTSGSVSAATRKISDLQKQIGECEESRGQLLLLQQEMTRLREEQKNLKQNSANLLDEIRKAPEAAARMTLFEQYQENLEKFGKIKEERDSILARFSGKPPTYEEINDLSAVFDNAAALKSGPELSATEIAEQRVLNENRARFADGLPSEEQLENCRQLCREYLKKENERKNACLSGSDMKRFLELSDFFASKVPDDDFLAECDGYGDCLDRLAGQMKQACLTLGEQSRLHELKNFFASGLPSDAEINRQKQTLKKIGELKQEEARLEADLKIRSEEKALVGKASKTFRSFLYAGILSLVAGIVLLALKHCAPGVALAALGIISFMAAAYLRLRQRISLEHLKRSYGGLKEQLGKNEAELDKLKSMSDEFLGRYFPLGAPPENASDELVEDLKEYLSLTERDKRFAEKRCEIGGEIDELQRRLSECLAPFFGNEIPQDAVMRLYVKKSEYVTLTRQKCEAEAEAGRLDPELVKLTGSITSFLSPYFDKVAPEDFFDLVSQLEHDCHIYLQARAHVEERAASAAKQAAKLAGCEKAVQSFNELHGLHLSTGDRGALNGIRDDVRRQEEDKKILEALRLKIENFQKEHPDVLGLTLSQPLPDIVSLSAEEKNIEEKLEEISEKIQKLTVKIRLMQRSADKIPGLDHELDIWKEQQAADIRRSELLDMTMEFLTKAKEQLSLRYLSGVKNRFEDYVLRLTRMSGGQFLINPDLGILVERLGAMREMAYLSVGQTDIIMLCMRLALIDELSKETGPLIVLDDPFVNLDDDNTKEALSLLKNLAADHQILYLVCNSSRSFRA